MINTGNRTDIPACYSGWFYNRIREGYVLVRNPYNPGVLTRYLLSPQVVDALVFCTKNPAPMLPRLSELDAFRKLFYVTITPYTKAVEPNVPPPEQVMDAFCRLSGRIGREHMIWRYDPVWLKWEGADSKQCYTVEKHLDCFEKMASRLADSTRWCVVSFIDLYEKTRRNFPGVREVSRTDQEELAEGFVRIGRKYGIGIKSCCEGEHLARFGVDCSGCMTKEVVEEACGIRLSVPAGKPAREGCTCLLGGDIGAYNTCTNGCLYCYANYDPDTVRRNAARHDPASPLLTGWPGPEDVIRQAKQTSWIDGQMSLF